MFCALWGIWFLELSWRHQWWENMLSESEERYLQKLQKWNRSIIIQKRGNGWWAWKNKLWSLLWLQYNLLSLTASWDAKLKRKQPDSAAWFNSLLASMKEHPFTEFSSLWLWRTATLTTLNQRLEKKQGQTISIDNFSLLSEDCSKPNKSLKTKDLEHSSAWDLQTSLFSGPCERYLGNVTWL